MHPEAELPPSLHCSVHAQPEPPLPLHIHHHAPSQTPLRESTDGALSQLLTQRHPFTLPSSHNFRLTPTPRPRHMTRQGTLARARTQHQLHRHCHHSPRPTRDPEAAHAAARRLGLPPGNGRPLESDSCTQSRSGDNAYRQKRTGPRTTP